MRITKKYKTSPLDLEPKNSVSSLVEIISFHEMADHTSQQVDLTTNTKHNLTFDKDFDLIGKIAISSLAETYILLSQSNNDQSRNLMSRFAEVVILPTADSRQAVLFDNTLLPKSITDEQAKIFSSIQSTFKNSFNPSGSGLTTRPNLDPSLSHSEPSNSQSAETNTPSNNISSAAVLPANAGIQSNQSFSRTPSIHQSQVPVENSSLLGFGLTLLIDNNVIGGHERAQVIFPIPQVKSNTKAHLVWKIDRGIFSQTLDVTGSEVVPFPNPLSIPTVYTAANSSNQIDWYWDEHPGNHTVEFIVSYDDGVTQPADGIITVYVETPTVDTYDFAQLPTKFGQYSRMVLS